jgi:hypothetical protein
LSLIATVVLATSASAGSITVPNYDFSTTPPGVIDNNAPSDSIPDFTVLASAAGYWGTLGQNDADLPSDPDVAFLNGNRGGTATFTTDTLNTTIAANTKYTLSLDIGFNSGNSPSSYQVPAPTVTLGFLAGNTPIGTTVTAAQIEADPTYVNGTNKFTTFTYSFTTGASGGYIGDDLEAQFGADMTGQTQTQFDDVRVTEIAAPEPSVYLMMLGGFGLLGLCLRKRALL